jgi:hypothetical protein
VVEDRSFLNNPAIVFDELRLSAPEVVLAADKLAHATRLVHLSVVPVDGPHRAVSVVLTQATNDLIDLLFDSCSGRGRPALRAARSLYELAVTLPEVVGDDARAERYMDHLAVAVASEAKLARPERALRGPARRRYARRRAVLGRESASRVDAAEAKYGRAFKRSWADGSLRDRATKAGFDDEDYEFYRLSSAILHGAAGGSLASSKIVLETRRCIGLVQLYRSAR